MIDERIQKLLDIFVLHVIQNLMAALINLPVQSTTDWIAQELAKGGHQHFFTSF